MISHPHRCIFIHIPKNGGASIERVIWPDEKDRTEENLWLGFKTPHRNVYQTGGLQHLFARNVKKAVGEKVFNEYFKFTMVRNPWDRVISQYLYLQKRKDLREFLGVPRHVSFVEYLKRIQEKPHVHWSPQTNFFLDNNGEVMVDYIARYEDYRSEVLFILKRIGLVREGDHDSVEIPHVNRSVRKPYWRYFSSETREMVAEIYRSDIEYFDYGFDESQWSPDMKKEAFPVPSNRLSAALLNLKDRF